MYSNLRTSLTVSTYQSKKSSHHETKRLTRQLEPFQQQDQNASNGLGSNLPTPDLINITVRR